MIFKYYDEEETKKIFKWWELLLLEIKLKNNCYKKFERCYTSLFLPKRLKRKIYNIFDKNLTISNIGAPDTIVVDGFTDPLHSLYLKKDSNELYGSGWLRDTLFIDNEYVIVFKTKKSFFIVSYYCHVDRKNTANIVSILNMYYMKITASNKDDIIYKKIEMDTLL